MTKLVTELALSFNMLTFSLPTQLGSLTNMNKGFYTFNNDELCGVVPTQVSALSNSVSRWVR